MWDGRLVYVGDLKVNAVNRDGLTPLVVAVKEGNSSAVGLLLRNGANVNAVDQHGLTPLHISARKGDLKSVKQLLMCSAADGTMLGGQALLYSAVLGGNPEIVELLLERGADAVAADRNGQTSLHEAARGMNPEVLSLLLRHVDAIPVGSDTWLELLRLAALYGAPKNMEILFGLGTEADVQNALSGSELICDVAKYGKCDVLGKIRMLHGKGLNVNARNDYDYASIFSAVYLRPIDVLIGLLDMGAGVDILNDYGQTVLHYCIRIRENCEPFVLELLDRFPELVNVRDLFGWTPLHYAASSVCLRCPEVDGSTSDGVPVRGGGVDVVLTLQGRGADVNARNFNGQTPLDLAIEGGNQDIIDSLRSRGALTGAEMDAMGMKFESPLCWVTTCCDTEGILRRRQSGWDANERDCFGRTPLHVARKKKDLELLLEFPGVDVNARCKDGNTPLHSIVNYEDLEVIEVLLAAPGVDVSAVNNNGQTPLDLARKYGNKGAVKLLRSKGARTGDQVRRLAAVAY
jgi:ankyrin repeat protein